jgi:hypothetical protein
MLSKMNEVQRIGLLIILKAEGQLDNLSDEELGLILQEQPKDWSPSLQEVVWPYLPTTPV